jgi:hypothetical protein
MMHKAWAFVIVLYLVLLSSIVYAETVETADSNKDGKIDSWIYRNDENVPVKWVRDNNNDGQEDSWSFFKNGKAYLDEVDYDGDGKVDTIYLNLYDENMKNRGISFVLDDKDKNIFLEKEDTGWSYGDE